MEGLASGFGALGTGYGLRRPETDFFGPAVEGFAAPP